MCFSKTLCRGDTRVLSERSNRTDIGGKFYKVSLLCLYVVYVMAWSLGGENSVGMRHGRHYAGEVGDNKVFVYWTRRGACLEFGRLQKNCRTADICAIWVLLCEIT